MFNRGAKQYGGEKIVFQQVMLEQLDIHMKKKKSKDGCLVKIKAKLVEVVEFQWSYFKF